MDFHTVLFQLKSVPNLLTLLLTIIHAGRVNTTLLSLKLWMFISLIYEFRNVLQMAFASYQFFIDKYTQGCLNLCAYDCDSFAYKFGIIYIFRPVVFCASMYLQKLALSKWKLFILSFSLLTFTLHFANANVYTCTVNVKQPIPMLNLVHIEQFISPSSPERDWLSVGHSCPDC